MTTPLDITLSINGGDWVSAIDLRVSFSLLQWVASGTDQLAFTQPWDRRHAPLRDDDLVRVRLDGTPFFAGRVGAITDALTQSSQRLSGVINGPWQWLESWPFLRNFTGNVNGLPAWAPSAGLSSEIDVFRSPTGSIMNAGAQAVAALAPVEYIQGAGTEFLVGPMPLGMIPPQVVSVSAISVAELINLCDRWQISQTRYMDYSSEVPVLRAASVAPDWLDLDRTTVPYTTISYTPTAIDWGAYIELAPADLVTRSAGLRARTDLWAQQLAIRSTTPGNYLQLANPSIPPPCGRAMWIEAGAVGPLPLGSASEARSLLVQPTYEGSISLRGIRRDLHPGSLLFLEGSATDSSISSMRAQSLTIDLLQRTTTVSVGLPRQFGVGDFLQLQSLGRRWNRA